MWGDKAAYDRAALDLSGRFGKNFEKFSDVAPEVVEAGPVVLGASLVWWRRTRQATKNDGLPYLAYSRGQHGTSPTSGAAYSRNAGSTSWPSG
jgi:hypothetical protein